MDCLGGEGGEVVGHGLFGLLGLHELFDEFGFVVGAGGAGVGGD